MSQDHFIARTKNKDRNKYKDNIHLVILALAFVFFLLSFVVHDSVWQSTLISIAANLITLTVFSFFIIEKLLDNQSQREREIARQDIKVFLHNSDTQELFPLELALKRGELNRSELMGRIGMLIQDTTTRYNIEYLKTIDFFKQVNEILENDKRQTLIIECSTAEVKQFKPLKAINSNQKLLVLKDNFNYG